MIAPLLAVMRHLNRQLAYSDDTIERVAAHDERVPRLRTVPSVGPVTAAAFVATVDDVQRFRDAHHLEAYLGLVPRELSSGDRQHRGPITKAGSGRPRWLLVQAAGSILRRRPPEAAALRAWAVRIAARHADRRRRARPSSRKLPPPPGRSGTRRWSAPPPGVSGCVRATVTDAFMRDIRCMLVREAVADRTPAVLEANLFDLDQKYADVVTLADALAYLARFPLAAPLAAPAS